MKTSILWAGLHALFCSTLTVCLLFAAMGAQAATYTVTTEAEAGSLDSASCTSIRCTLRDAINAALTNTDLSNTIQFSSTLSSKTISLTQYSNDITSTPSRQFGPSAFFIPAGKTMTIDATVNGVTSAITVQRDSSADNFRLFDVGMGATLTLRGLVLANGVAQGGGSYVGGSAMGAGGAVFSQGTLTLERCLISGNQALGGSSGYSAFGGNGGGGVGANGGTAGGGPNGGAKGADVATGTGGTGSNGGLGGGGGGGGSATSGNRGNGGGGGFGGGGGGLGGGGVFGGNGGNGGFGGGGGQRGPGSNGYGVGVTGEGGFGGGGGSSSAVAGGGAGLGGGVFNDAGSLTITNSSFIANSALGGSGNPTGGTVVSNGLGFGGAVFNYSGSLVLNGVTLAGNSVSGGTTDGGRTGSDGGAIYSLADGNCGNGDGNTCNNGTNATLSMFNSVAVNNTGTGNSAPNDVALNAINVTNGSPTSTVLASSHNAIGAQSPADAVAANITSGFMLATSLNNNVLPPLPGSPLIDAGKCDAMTPALTYDQLGTARPQGAACDIGAVELPAPLLSLVSLSNTTSSGSKLSATSNIAATGYWLVVPTGSTAPTAGQIQAGSSYGSVTVVASGSGGMSANVVTTFSIIGLSPATSYDLYLVATSTSGGTSMVSTLLDWTTPPAQTVTGPVPSGGSGTITATLMGPEGCDFASYSFDALPTGATAPPPGYSLPYGAFQFTTNAQCGGGPISFTLSYPDPVPANAQYHKFGPTPSKAKPAWYVMPNISISGKSVTFQITDGQLGDDDLTANGVIVDGGGLTVPLPADVNAIPTLGQWGLALLAALCTLLGLAALAPRRQGRADQSGK